MPFTKLAFGFCLVLCVVQFANLAQAREWTFRTGESIGAAELVDAGKDFAILKLTVDGKLTKVPFAKLSLGDVQYVRDAMKSAGVDLETHVASVMPAETEPPASSTDSATAVKSNSPPLARTGQANWQAVPDPGLTPWTPKDQQDLRIPIPGRFSSNDDVLFAPFGGPFAALGKPGNDTPCELWDLRAVERIGIIRENLGGVQRAALSSDGKCLAICSSKNRGKIELWSFETGQKVHEIPLLQEYSSVYGLDFAGSARLIAALPNENALVVYDLKTLKGVTKIPVRVVPMQDKYAVSPGGNYVGLIDGDRLQIIDTRNAVIAGDATIPVGKERGYVNVVGVNFSRDGDEFAVMTDQGDTQQLVCWSMKTGKVVEQHQLVEELPSHSSRHDSRTQIIDWLPSQRGWLVQGQALVDRKKGGPVWIAADERSYSVTRRVADDRRMLIASGDSGSRTLDLVDIPWNQIAEAERVVSKGGMAKDAGLPELTVFKSDSARQLVPSATKAEYVAVPAIAVPKSPKPIVFTATDGMPKSMLFALNSTPRVAIGSDPADYKDRRKGMELSRSGQFVDVFDLASGNKVCRFEPPFATDLIDVSPSGKLGIYRELKDKDRLDVFELETGKHIVGFRPARGDLEKFRREVTWAGLLDEERVMTVDRSGKLVAWSLAEKNSLFELDTGNLSGAAFLSPSRSHFITNGAGRIITVFSVTGQVCARLAAPPDTNSGVISAASFRADGRCLAVLYFLDDQRRLVIWDIPREKILSDVTVPYPAFDVSWCGKAHVVLHNTGERTESHRSTRQITIVEAPTGRVAWNYQIPIGSQSGEGFDDRYWTLIPGSDIGDKQLIAVSLPDKEALDEIAAQPPEKPLFGPGATVALHVKIGGFPDDLDDRRQREEQLERTMRTHFVKLLEQRGIKTAETAPIHLDVSMKNLTQEDIVTIRSRYSWGRSATFVLSTKQIHTHVVIRRGVDLTLWEKHEFTTSKEAANVRGANKLSFSSMVLLGQWQEAQRWCQALELPHALFHPDVYHGLGESALSANGARVLRKFPTPE